MQDPEDLIVRLVEIRLIGVARNIEVHRDRGIAHGAGSKECLRHILVRLPKNGLLDGPIFTIADRDLANAAETEVNAVSGIGIEVQVNRTLQRASGRKGERGELKIGTSKTFPADAGSYRRDCQNDAKNAKHKRKKDCWIGGAPEVRHDCGRNSEHHPIHKDRRRPKANGAVAVPAFCAPNRPVLPPQPRRFRIGLLRCRLLAESPCPVNGGEDDPTTHENEDGRNQHSHPAIALDPVGCTE